MNEVALNTRFYSDSLPLLGTAKDKAANEGKSRCIESGIEGAATIESGTSVS